MADKTKITGIYKVTSPVGLVYIGQSRNVNKRIRYFINTINHNRKLYSSIIEYGWDAHKSEIVHELPQDVEQEVLNTYEKLYMECYKDCGIELLNVKAGGNGKYPEEKKGWHHSEETKIKMKLRQVGRGWNRNKKVVCSATGVIYDSIKDAALSKGMNKSTLSMQLAGVYRNKTTLKYL